MEEEKKQPKTMVLRSDHYDHPMRFERAMNLMLYRITEDYRVSGKYSFEVRTNAKLPNPATGRENIRINVKNKKDADGLNIVDSRPDAELEDSEAGLWLIVDAKNYSSSNIPKTDELFKDIKCRYKRKPQYSPTVGMLVCSTN
jgi:hypothetical protein